jgi:hypothetical protein
LNREPESNVVSLGIEGAAQFDFFRQPDFIPDPVLAGSYAVYKKEALLGEGTGKLCHIHRPKIIDSRGRWVWGDLSIIGDRLLITIPERWLSEAAYPVIVDPTIGTTTVGSQNKWVQEEGEVPVSLMFELAIPVNRFLVPEGINGLCTAYIYTNEDDEEAGGRPVLYSDNGNKPETRKSTQEGLLDLRVTGSKPKGWRSATFGSNGSIASGSYIWFGVFNEYFWLPRFDYGAKCFVDYWYGNDTVDESIPDAYPIYDVNDYKNFKLSMYFTYTSAQSYTRTLTQGVTLTDSRKLTADYKRTAAETVMGSAVLGRFASFPRLCVEIVKNSMTIKVFPTFIRSVVEQVRATMGLSESRGFSRNCVETINVETETKRSQGFYRKTQDGVKGSDASSFPVLFLRVLPETAAVTETTGHWGA